MEYCKRPLESATDDVLPEAKRACGAFPAQQNYRVPVFSVPGEVRNRIYREVLLQDEPVEIDERYRRPPLLAVCRQIRNETTGIWYEENTFIAEVQHCDFEPLNRVLEAALLAGHIENFEVEMHIYNYRRPSWNPLIRSCYAIWKSEYSCKVCFDENVKNSLIAPAHEIAEQTRIRKEPWSQCVDKLQDLRDDATLSAMYDPCSNWGMARQKSLRGRKGDVDWDAWASFNEDEKEAHGKGLDKREGMVNSKGKNKSKAPEDDDECGPAAGREERGQSLERRMAFGRHRRPPIRYQG